MGHAQYPSADVNAKSVLMRIVVYRLRTVADAHGGPRGDVGGVDAEANLGQSLDDAGFVDIHVAIIDAKIA
jgi:hypothetical protein